jgi:hypothetical protein
VRSDCGLYRGRECPCMWWSWRWARFSRAWYITGLLVAHRGGEILGKDVTMICYSFLRYPCWIGFLQDGRREWWTVIHNGAVFNRNGDFQFGPWTSNI